MRETWHKAAQRASDRVQENVMKEPRMIFVWNNEASKEFGGTILTKRDRKRYIKEYVDRDPERQREKETDIQTDMHTVTADRQIDRQNDR